MRNSRDHLGARFEVWTGESTWFWHVFNPHNNGGAVGVAATEADAIREACMAIEERCTSGCETTSSARLIIDFPTKGGAPSPLGGQSPVDESRTAFASQQGGTNCKPSNLYSNGVVGDPESCIMGDRLGIAGGHAGGGR
jgi:hypothetical protein